MRRDARAVTTTEPTPVPSPVPGFDDDDAATADTAAVAVVDDHEAAPPSGVRGVLADAVFPAPAGEPARWWTVGLLFLGTAVLFALRVPWPLTFDRVWAEDGSTFLTEQSLLGYPHALFRSYAGYMHSVPRTAAALVSLLPVDQQAAGLAVVTAAVVGLAAVLVHLVVRDLTGRAVYGVVAAAYLVAAPVGDETLGNLANLQWRLLPAAVLLALWTPRSRGGVALVALVLLAATTSSPFGAIAVVVLLVRMVVRPSKVAAVLLAAAGIGTVVQVMVALGAPDRPLKPVPGVQQLVDQYALRVVGDGLLGERIVGQIDIPLATRVGQTLLVLVLGLLLVAAVRGGRRTALRIVGVGLIGVATYVAPMLLGAPAFTDPSSARYYLAPAALLVVTLLVAGGPRNAARATTRERHGWRLGAVAPPLAATVVLALVMLASGFLQLQIPQQGFYAPTTLRWHTAVAQARAACAADPSGRATIPINPAPTWFARLPCSDLVR